MEQNKQRPGLTTMWALLLLPAIIGGAGLTAWKLRAETPEQTTLQQVREELDQAHKAEVELKKHLEEAQEANQTLERERNQAVVAEKEAHSSTDDAKAVLAFVQDNVLLAPGRPTSWSREGLGKDVTLRKAVDLAATKVTGGFPDRPLVEASIREMLGASYSNLGDAALAVKQYERAFELRQTILGSDNPDTCDCRNKLAVAYRDAGHTDKASLLYDLSKRNDKPSRPASQPQRAPAASQPAGQKG